MAQRPVSWKAKYLQSLERQEREQKNYNILLQLLSQAALRLSRLSEGTDSQLDKQLKSIQTLLAAESIAAKDLKTIVDALAGQLTRMDKLKTNSAKQLTKSFSQLLKQLNRYKPIPDDKAAIKAFEQKLAKQSPALSALAATLEQYVSLQDQVLSQAEARPQPPSLWQQLWGKKEEEPLVSDVSTASTPIPEQQKPQEAIAISEDLEQLPELMGVYQPSDEEVEPPFSKFNDAVCGLLLELLKQIKPPPMARVNYSSAVDRLEQGLNWYELVAMLEQISIIVISAFDSDHQMFEQFLKQLNERLQLALEWVADSQDYQSETQQASEQLCLTTEQQVVEIQSVVTSSSDLASLKSAVNQRVDAVLQAVAGHRQQAGEREQQMAEKLKQMHAEITALQEQAKDAERQIEEHRQRALRDVLTQLPNREAYQQHLSQEFERWQRYQRPLTVVVCDIDHFKSINDNYGHQAGDKVLRIIAKSLASRLRKTDFIARYGGEEFVILMSETQQPQAVKVIDSVREAIASCPFHFKERPVSITLSFGVSECRSGDEPEDLFARADTALYKAKENGRNRVEVAE